MPASEGLRLAGLDLRRGEFRLTADFALPEGARLALIGPSGAGKSTLLDAIAGFLAPAAGRILWRGADLGPLPPGARPVAMIFQDQNLFPHLSAAQNVGLGLRPALKLTADEQARVEAALARVGLAGLGGRRPAQLSGGQQSRVALARMALQDRPLVLMDEPFAALGPALRAEMLDLVAELVREAGSTLVFVTHDPEDARRIASHVIFVDEGCAAPPVGTAAFFADPPEGLRRYLG